MCLAALAAVTASPAAAAQPVYYNKAGVAQERYAEDYGECSELAGGVARPRTLVISNSPIAAAAGSFFAALLDGAEQRNLMRMVLRTCMADKGYRRIRMSEISEAQIGKLKGADKEAAIYRMASADTIEGE